MFGSANGLQLSIYNKTLQARATDKLDYWESVVGDLERGSVRRWRPSL